MRLRQPPRDSKQSYRWGGEGPRIVNSVSLVSTAVVLVVILLGLLGAHYYSGHRLTNPPPPPPPSEQPTSTPTIQMSPQNGLPA